MRRSPALQLKVEAMAQLGGLICLQEPCSDGKGTFFFGGVDGVSSPRAHLILND